MVKVSVKISYYFVLFITGIALIGVNVRLLHCCHSADSVIEVRMMPDDGDEPCSDDCCGKGQCHTYTNHTFFKITDFSKIEPSVQISPIVYIQTLLVESLPLVCNDVVQLIQSVDIEYCIEPPSCSLLCTYIC